MLGPVRITRAWYHCLECRRGFAPRDQQLGVGGGSMSPGLAEMIALAGAEVSFARAAGLLAGLAGIAVSPRTVERSAEATGAAAREAAGAEATAIRERRIVPLPPRGPLPDMLYVEVDGTGVPVRASETEGRTGKSEDGKAGTREVKLARFFTVSGLDAGGGRSWTPAPPATPSASTARTPSPACEGRVPAPRRRPLPPGRGNRRRRRVDLGMAGELYPHATHITDIDHAREHLHDLAAHLAFITPGPAAWLAERSAELDAGEIQAIIDAARAYPMAGVKAEELDRKLGYFERNAHRMRYADFKDLGMFIGSGAIEGGIKAIVVQRAKQSGMHWTIDGAADILALRASAPAAAGTTRHARRCRAARRRLTDTATQNREGHSPVKIIPNDLSASPAQPAREGRCPVLRSKP